MGWEHAERSSSPHWTLPAPRGPRSRDASSPSAASGTFTHLHLPQIPFQTQLPLEGCMHVCSVMSDSLQPMGCSLPGSPIHEIFQARILEWVAISSSRGFSRSRDRTYTACIGRQILYRGATAEAHITYRAATKGRHSVLRCLI